MFGFKRRRQERRRAFVREIASEVVSTLENTHRWKEFLPPVAFRDYVYLVTKDGTIYRMGIDQSSGMETICKIHQH